MPSASIAHKLPPNAALDVGRTYGKVPVCERRDVPELRTAGMGREFGIGLLVGAGLYAACEALLMALGIYRIEGLNPLRYLIPGVAMAVSSSVFEELLFRGVLYRSVEAWFGSWAALGISAAASLGIYMGDLSQQVGELSFAQLWNTTVRLILLVAIGQFTARVRRDRDILRRLLAKETTARIATVEQLRHRDRLATVGQISSGIAHEVGTPLNVIGGRARLITETDTTLIEAKQHAAAIVEQSERVASTIRQLLDFARRRGPQQEMAHIGDLARRVLGLLRPLAGKRSVELVLLSGGTAAAAAVDSTQIEQALSNLVMNAIQAIPDGGTVRVGVDTVSRPMPEDGSGPLLEHVRLTVEDSGTGIATENLPHIFEPFFTTQQAGAGTGLGLSITHEIIRDHGGWIEVRSEPWKGSRFTVFLPKEAQSVRIRDP